MVTSAPLTPSPRASRLATIADWLAVPEEKGAELLRGRIVYKAHPTPEHGLTQTKLGELLGPFNRKPGDAERPGGWWLATEVDIRLGDSGLRPDLAGWRRDRAVQLPKPEKGGAVTERPDFIAEVISPSTASRDLGEKLAIYHAAEIPHYWVIDPSSRMLIVYRFHPEGYLLVLGASADKTVHAEPFDALALHVGALFGDDPEEPAAEPEAPSDEP